eukprot:1044576-Rhodomonas_salina.1
MNCVPVIEIAILAVGGEPSWLAVLRALAYWSTTGVAYLSTNSNTSNSNPNVYLDVETQGYHVTSSEFWTILFPLGVYCPVQYTATVAI